MIKTFVLDRHEDLSGISGIGVVAEGAVFSNGKCVLVWLTKMSSVVIYESLEDMLAIHGHDGKTKIVWDRVSHS